MKFWRRNGRRTERKENEWVCVWVCVRVWEFEWVRARERRKGERFNQALFTFWIKVDLLLNNARISRPILCLPFPLSRCNLFVVRICFWLRYTLCIHSYSPSLSLPYTHPHTHSHSPIRRHTPTRTYAYTHLTLPPSFNPFKFSFDQVVWFTIFQIQTKFFPLWC